MNAQQGSFNITSGIITANGSPIIGINYDGNTSRGVLVEVLSDAKGTMWDITDDGLSNPRAARSLGALGGRFTSPNGTRIPVALVAAMKGNEFRDALGPYTDQFWRVFQQGGGAIYHQSTNDGVYHNQMYSVSEYRFVANYAIQHSTSTLHINFIFQISVYDPK